MLALDFEQGPAGVLVEGVTITQEGAVAGVVVITVGDKEPVAGVAAVDAVSTDLTKEAQVVVAVDVVWVDLGFPHPENLMSASTSSRSTLPHTLVSLSFFHFNCESCCGQDK